MTMFYKKALLSKHMINSLTQKLFLVQCKTLWIAQQMLATNTVTERNL